MESSTQKLVKHGRTLCKSAWKGKKGKSLTSVKSSVLIFSLGSKKPVWTPISRIHEYIRRLGWGEELDLLRRWDDQPESIPVVNRACRKELTDSG